MHGPVVEDNLSKTALFAFNWPQSEVGGVLFTLVQQQVLVLYSYFHDD